MGAALRGCRPEVASGAVAADELLLVRELAAVVHEETAHAGELVQLLGLHLDRQLLVREVSAGKLEGLGCFGLVLVDLPGVLVVTPRLELFEAVLVLLFLGLPRCVVVGCHSFSPAPKSQWFSRPAPVVRVTAQIVHHSEPLCTLEPSTGLHGWQTTRERAPSHGCSHVCRSHAPGHSTGHADPAPRKSQASTRSENSDQPSAGAHTTTSF